MVGLVGCRFGLGLGGLLCMCVCVYVCMCVCMDACMCVCVYVVYAFPHMVLGLELGCLKIFFG